LLLNIIMEKNRIMNILYLDGGGSIKIVLITDVAKRSEIPPQPVFSIFHSYSQIITLPLVRRKEGRLLLPY
jgi:hypothetical protein